MKRKYLIVAFSFLLAVAIIPCVNGVSIAQADQKSVEDQTNEIYDNMNEKERICQTLMVHMKRWGGTTYDDSTPLTKMNEDVRKLLNEYHYGSFMFFSENIPTTDSTFKFVQDIQKESMKPLAKGAKGLPVLFENDHEGGVVFRLEEGTNMLGSMATGATFDPQCAANEARVFAEELKSLGINYDDCPCIDVNSNAGNPIINLRSFGDDPDQVADMGEAFTKSMYSNGLLACIKHFPGHGDVDVDSHKALPSSDKNWDELLNSDIVPYKKCIPLTKMVMTAHIQFPNVIGADPKLIADKPEHMGDEILAPATLSHTFITDKLKGELGFRGIAVTDALDMNGIALYFTEPTAAKLAIAAGDDMLCQPITAYNYQEYVNHTEAIISSISEWALESSDNAARLEDAVKNVIRTKIETGVINWNASDYSLENAHETLRSPEHLATQYEDTAKSVTVVKNNNDTLPIKLDSSSKVLFLCQNPSNRNEDGVSALAWNRLKATGLCPEGATPEFITFKAGEKEETGPYTLTPSFDEINAAIDEADIVIIDSGTNSNDTNGYLSWRTDAPNKMATYAHSKGKKAVVISKRFPYDCQLYPDADAILVTYNHVGTSNLIDYQTILDNNITETADVSGPSTIEAVELIFGNIGASGRLPVNIPRFNSSTKNYDNDDLVYENGFGLKTNQLLSVNNVKMDFDVSHIDTTKPLEGDNLPKAIVTTSDATVTYSSGNVQNSNAKQVGFTIPVARQQRTFEEGKDYVVTYDYNWESRIASATITGIGDVVGSKTVSFEIPANPSTTAQTFDNNMILIVCLLALFVLSFYVVRKKIYLKNKI